MALRLFIPNLFRARAWPHPEAMLRTTARKEDVAYDGYASSRAGILVSVHFG